MEPPPGQVEGLLTREIARLAEEFRGTFSHETIDRYVRELLHQFNGARITQYVPILAYRFSHERLRALARVEGLIRVERPHLLFVCVRNAARSQMAAALAAHLRHGQV